MAKQEKSGQQSVGRAGAASADEARGNDPRRSSLGDLLSFYYPMHYRIGIDVETVMGQGRISRKQGTILWLIHSRGDKDGWLRRKLIEERLSAWLEISNSSVSNILRELTRPPHTSELQSLMRISYAVFCLKKKKNKSITKTQQRE